MTDRNRPGWRGRSPRLNIWHRLGIVLSVLWIAATSYYQLSYPVSTAAFDPNKPFIIESAPPPKADAPVSAPIAEGSNQALGPWEKYQAASMKEAGPKDVDIPTPIDAQADVGRKLKDWLTILRLSAQPVLVAWLVIYAIVWTCRWVWAGRRITRG